MNSTINPILEVRKQSRLFNEPLPPKPTAESLATDLNEVIEELHDTTFMIRRMENRLIVLKAKIEGLQTIQRP